MRSTFFKLASAVALLLSLSAFAFGQETDGQIEITTRDQQGNVVPGVTVTIRARSSVDASLANAASTTGFSRTVTTDQNGFFRVVEIPPGFYSVTAGATAGFGELTLNNVEIVLGKTTPVNFELRAGGVAETVTVQGDAVAIDPTDNKIQTNITAQIAELLPKGENFTSLLQVSPAVRNEPLSGGFQVDGASGSENTFIIDGQDVTNFRTGTLSANNNIPFSFVQEVQIKSSGFEAEFGGATGGVINVVTKGGNNEFHGEFGIRFRPGSLQAGPRQILNNIRSDADFFRPTRDSGTDVFPTLNFSGPVVRDRAWFFLSYSPQYLKTIRNVDYLDGDEVFQTERYVRRQTNQFAFVRADADLFENVRFSGSYTYNPIIVEGVPDTQLNGLTGSVPFADFGPGIGFREGADLANQQGGRQNSQNVTGQLTWTPTSRLVVTARGGYSFLNEKVGSYGVPNVIGNARIFISGLAVASAIPAEAGGVRGSTNGFPFAETLVFDASRRRTFDADASYFVSDLGGRHQFKGGYQFNGLSNSVLSSFVDQVSVRYGRDINFTSGIPATILPPTPGAIGSGLLQRFSESGSASSNNQAIYIQDSYQPTSRLSINAGVRIEKESAPSFIAGRPSVEFDFFDKVAPRLGVAYDLTGDGRTKLFASYGQFYDRFKYELPRGSFGGNFFRVDYFEIFPGQGDFRTAFTPARIVGNTVIPPGGQCPFNISGILSRCQSDFRVASNAGLPILETGGIDPDIKPFRQTEFTVGFERDLGAGFNASGRYTRKQVDRAVEDIGFFNEQASEVYIIGNPGEGLAREIYEDLGFIPFKAQRDYDAFEIRLDKRFTRRYYFNANYTLSRLFGNYSGLASSDEDGRQSPNVNRYFDQPFIGYTALGQPDNGRLATDRPHAFKFYGAYTLDWAEQLGFGAGNDTEFSLFTTVQSGTPLTTRFDFRSLDSVVLSERGDLGRTEAFTQSDVAIRHKYRFGSNERFTMVFDLDVLNVFNENNTLGVFDLISGNNFSGSELGLTDDPIIAGGRFQRTNTLNQVLSFINDNDLGEARYLLPDTFQAPRTIRFGFRFLF